jgi:hypothetical protein
MSKIPPGKATTLEFRSQGAVWDGKLPGCFEIGRRAVCVAHPLTPVLALTNIIKERSD